MGALVFIVCRSIGELAPGEDEDICYVRKRYLCAFTCVLLLTLLMNRDSIFGTDTSPFVKKDGGPLSIGWGAISFFFASAASSRCARWCYPRIARETEVANVAARHIGVPAAIPADVILESMPTMTHAEAKMKPGVAQCEECALCLSSFLATTNVRVAKCGHIFCAECLQNQLTYTSGPARPQCSLCRRSLMDEPELPPEQATAVTIADPS